MSSGTNGIDNIKFNRNKVNEINSDDDGEALEKIQTLIPAMKRNFSVHVQQFQEFLRHAERLETLPNVREMEMEKEKWKQELEQIKAELKEIEKQLESNADSRVYLDVGGQPFTTTIKTLTQGNSLFFKTLINEKWNKITNTSNEPIFIDRDGKLFDFILKYLRTGELNVEDKTIRRELLLEAKYYKLSALEDELNSTGKKEDLPTSENLSDTFNQSPPSSPLGTMIRTRASPIPSSLSVSARVWSPTPNQSVLTKAKLHPAHTAGPWRSASAAESRLNVFIGSVLLTNEYEEKLLEFIGSDIPSSQQTWRLIYRASEHGFEASDFHRRCDTYAPTVSIIHADSGNIFGGYTVVPWSSATVRADQPDPTAFLFTLKNNLSVPPTKFPIAEEFQQSAISHNPTCGPNFGSPKNEGSDLCLRGKFNEKTNCIFFPRSYTDTTNYGASIFAKKYFACRDVEVFTLTDNN